MILQKILIYSTGATGAVQWEDGYESNDSDDKGYPYTILVTKQAGLFHATQSTYMAQPYHQSSTCGRKYGKQWYGWRIYLYRKYQLKQTCNPSCGHRSIEQRQCNIRISDGEDMKERANISLAGQDAGTSGEYIRQHMPPIGQVIETTARHNGHDRQPDSTADR